MKKKSIKKLNLTKASISTLNAQSITGGFGDSVNFCESVNICQTVDVTRCYGNLNCGLFNPRTNEC